MIWPASQLSDVDTAFVHVDAAAGKPMVGIIGFQLLVANFGDRMGRRSVPPAYSTEGRATRCRSLFSA